MSSSKRKKWLFMPVVLKTTYRVLFVSQAILALYVIQAAGSGNLYYYNDDDSGDYDDDDGDGNAPTGVRQSLPIHKCLLPNILF